MYLNLLVSGMHGPDQLTWPLGNRKMRFAQSLT
jgi:hypothetical protein